MRCLQLPGAPVILRLLLLLVHVRLSALAKRHVVYWNSSNTRLTSDDYTVQVKLNDYLDILCPHYPPDSPLSGPPETLALYLVAEAQFRGCQETEGAIKRWECKDPQALYGPIRFTEKIQRFTPFSLGTEFLPGHHYYYSSLSTDDGSPLPCMKLKVTVCCQSTTAAVERGKDSFTGVPAPRGPACPQASCPLLVLVSSSLFLLTR
ncbi:ephrin-A4 [Electrophorus electricus]|uniref:ephrin-A4 n=1 Tax=Electrophorus electricus TaxID=8005 RepID=UPI000F09FB36|nr:ephrin-A4 [Electrophorus electricus]